MRAGGRVGGLHARLDQHQQQRPCRAPGASLKISCVKSCCRGPGTRRRRRVRAREHWWTRVGPCWEQWVSSRVEPGVLGGEAGSCRQTGRGGAAACSACRSHARSQPEPACRRGEVGVGVAGGAARVWRVRDAGEESERQRGQDSWHADSHARMGRWAGDRAGKFWSTQRCW